MVFTIHSRPTCFLRERWFQLDFPVFNQGYTEVKQGYTEHKQCHTEHKQCYTGKKYVRLNNFESDKKNNYFKIQIKQKNVHLKVNRSFYQKNALNKLFLEFLDKNNAIV